MLDMREQICRQAVELFLQQGYDNTALSQIAKACGLTKAGLYHYFSNKEELLYECHRLHIETYFKPLLDEAEELETPTQRIECFVNNYIKLVTADPHARILIQETKRLSYEHQKEIKYSWQKAYNLVKNAIIELEDNGEFKSLNPSFAAFSLIGMVTWVFYWFDYSQLDTTDELTETFLEIFLDGIRHPVR